MKDREGQIRAWLGLCRNYAVKGRGEKRDLGIAACFFYDEMIKLEKQMKSHDIDRERAVSDLENKRLEAREVRKESYDLRQKLKTYESSSFTKLVTGRSSKQ